jgi:chemotaxis protein MotA
MDIASVAGLILAIVLVVASIATSGGTFAAFIDPASILVVFGGCLASVLISFPLENFLSVFEVTKKVFNWKLEPVQDIIDQLVSLAETARRDGLLALESRLQEIDNPFVILGVQMAVDGTRPEAIEDILRTELDALATRHRDGKALLDTMGKYAPAFGMIGTLLGLIMMLGDMSDPATIGAGMAVALLTTLYGSLAANCVFLPFADKLGFTNKQELLTMEIIVRGILAIQAGENPRVIAQKLTTFVPPKMRGKGGEAA